MGCIEGNSCIAIRDNAGDDPDAEANARKVLDESSALQVVCASTGITGGVRSGFYKEGLGLTNADTVHTPYSSQHMMAGKNSSLALVLYYRKTDEPIAIDNRWGELGMNTRDLDADVVRTVHAGAKAQGRDGSIRIGAHRLHADSRRPRGRVDPDVREPTEAPLRLCSIHGVIWQRRHVAGARAA